MVNLYCPDVKLVASTDSVSTTVNAINEHKPDIILLDTEMKEGTGFDVLEQFPAQQFKVIFGTAYQQYAVHAFRFAALDYILKPVGPDLLSESLNRAVDYIDRLKIDSFIYHNMDNISKGSKKLF